jgi:tRNA pseudouridine38-40 synthase
MRYFASISYRGTNFHGWQKQPGVVTVQETLESAITLLINDVTGIIGCGRTDTGVHASQYYFHFDSGNLIEAHNLIHRLNLMLPADIVVHNIIPVSDDTHARFSALSRSYTYFISGKKLPFQKKQYWWLSTVQKLDFKKLQETADLLPKYNDFTAFSKLHSGAKTHLCKIEKAEWYFNPEENTLRFDIKSDRFLRGMVRLMVGCCIMVAKGKLELIEVKKALENKEKLPRSWSVPPDGLFLSDITYPSHVNL